MELNLFVCECLCVCVCVCVCVWLMDAQSEAKKTTHTHTHTHNAWPEAKMQKNQPGQSERVFGCARFTSAGQTHTAQHQRLSVKEIIPLHADSSETLCKY